MFVEFFPSICQNMLANVHQWNGIFSQNIALINVWQYVRLSYVHFVCTNVVKIIDNPVTIMADEENKD